MKKEILIGIALVVLVLIGVTYLLWPEKKAEDIEIQVPSQAVSVPDVNPVNKTNPFSDVKTNPFE